MNCSDWLQTCAWTTVCTFATRSTEPEPLADVNRQQFLDAKFQESALKFIKTCTSSSSELDVDDLKIAKTAVGALLNSCYGFGLSIYPHTIQ
jgi:hypothetical protein